MQDGSPQSLYQLAMRRLQEIKTTKQAFIGAQEMQANMQQQQQATQMAAAQPQPGMPMDPGMMPGAPMTPPSPRVCLVSLRICLVNPKTYLPRSTT